MTMQSPNNTKTTWRELPEMAKRWGTWLKLGENLSFIKWSQLEPQAKWVAKQLTQPHRSLKLAWVWSTVWPGLCLCFYVHKYVQLMGSIYACPYNFLHRGSPSVRLSFSGFCLNRDTISHLDFPSRYSPFLSPSSHNFCWFHVLCWNEWKRKLMYCFYCFEYGNALSSLGQGKKLQHFLLDGEAKLQSFVSWTGQAFPESAAPPYPNSCWVLPQRSHQVLVHHGRIQNRRAGLPLPSKSFQTCFYRKGQQPHNIKPPHGEGVHSP